MRRTARASGGPTAAVAAAGSTAVRRSTAVAFGGESFAAAVQGAILVWAPGRRAPDLRLAVDGDVTALAVAAGGGALVATVNVGWKGSLRVWPLPAGEPSDPISLGGIVNAAAFSADGDTLVALAVPTGPWMGPLRGYEDVKLLPLGRAWQQGHLVIDELRHDAPVRRLALGPADEHVATVAEPAIVHVWSVTGRPRGRISSATAIRAFAVSADGDRLATAHDDGTVRLTDVATASTVLAVEAEARAVAVAPDGNLVVTGDEETVVWSAYTGAEIAHAQVGFPTGGLAFGPAQLLVKQRGHAARYGRRRRDLPPARGRGAGRRVRARRRPRRDGLDAQLRHGGHAR